MAYYSHFDRGINDFMNIINKTNLYRILFGVIAVFIVGVVFVLPTTAEGSGYSYGTPIYNYDRDYNYDYNDSGPIRVSCYPIPTHAEVDETVVWYASAYGGNNSYHFTWSGTNGLSGTGSSINKRYSSEGTKSASVTVRSGNKTVSENCGNTTRITDDRDYDYDDDYDYDYDYDRYDPLYVSCTADRVNASIGTFVRWTAYASGGDGRYTYRWDGSDNLDSSSRSVSKSYSRTGEKTASVTVRSDGRSLTRYCSNSVYIGGYDNYYTQYPQYPQNQNNLDVACFADPVTARVNQPVSWKAEATGGVAPYTYVWTGTDGLAGSDSSVLKYYSTTGDKSAVVTIKSADGRSAVKACTNAVTVRAATTSVTPRSTPPATPAQEVEEDDNALSAAALFSLKNVPWGWVALLIIFVLFATVVYLLFNRPKI